MDLTKILTVLKTVFALMKIFKRAKDELDETKTNESEQIPKGIQKEHRGSQSEPPKSA